MTIRHFRKPGLAAVLLALAMQCPAQAATAPAIDGDLAASAVSDPVTLPGPAPEAAAAAPRIDVGTPEPSQQDLDTKAATAEAAPPPANARTTYHKDDLIGAAEGLFGKGAAGLAGIIEDLLGKQGEPNGYIVGREGGGALVVGLRYGSGTLHHKIEGERPTYWTGPSIGFDAGANAASTFVLVYNLFDTEDLYKRFGAGEGQAYLVGGFHVSYMRRGDIVLIPVRSGAGLRLGINAGYMKFSHKQNWIPF